MPRGNAIITANIVDNKASSKDRPIRAAISAETGSSVHNEMPKSPRGNPLIYFIN